MKLEDLKITESYYNLEPNWNSDNEQKRLSNFTIQINTVLQTDEKISQTQRYC